MKLILSKLEATTKEQVISEIAEVASAVVGIKAETLDQGFKAREAQTSTGMVEGIAIPHTMQAVIEPCLIVCKSAQLNDWETLDGTAVELEIAIIAPMEGEQHLKILSQVSRKLINSDNINALKAATDVATVKAILEL